MPFYNHAWRAWECVTCSAWFDDRPSCVSHELDCYSTPSPTHESFIRDLLALRDELVVTTRPDQT